MKNDSVKKYYDILVNKRYSFFLKRLFDIITSLIMLVILLPIFLVLSVIIKLDSNGPVFFRQVRVTQYGKQFRIYKFRTMVNHAENFGTQITTMNDIRVTKIGSFLRKYRLDEIPQLLNIITGDMSFVGTRPEVPKYVQHYTDEMMATLLLPAGVTSEASIHYKNEEKILSNVDDADKTYIEIILPEKMRYNLNSLENFSLIKDIKTIISTIIAVFK